MADVAAAPESVEVVAPPTDVAKRGGMGTFGGVFTPSVLTILGVIMYLRFGWVLGNVGLVPALGIVTLATLITLLTACSVAEIATDRVVRVGGAYYMISRALGIETGGAVGVPLFLAQALSVALYTIGFAESITLVYPQVDQRTVAVLATIGVTVVALTSAKLAIRAQYLIMAAIALSLGSFFAGHPVDAGGTELWVGHADSPGFWAVFAVFFPAVTGIMAGVSMSGDLREPSRSIPRGTFAAVGVGYVVYMTVPVFLAMRAEPSTLVSDPLVMQRMSVWGLPILFGLWGATLSSALGSVLGAPRVLQALALDGVLPRWLWFLGRGTGSGNEPRAGTMVTLLIALGAVWVGDLDLIAPVLTMFFLTTYMVLNLAAGVERLVDSPSFRPTFSVHWSLSFLGAASCLGVMWLINPVASVVAAGVVGGLYVWLERRELQTTWGDARKGIWMSLMRSSLLRAEREHDPRNWRPHLLVLSGAPSRRWPLIQLGANLTHNKGLMTIVSVVQPGAFGVRRRHGLEQTIGDHLKSRSVHAMVRVASAESPLSGARALLDNYGLGLVAPNTLMLGMRHEEDVDDYAELIAYAHEARKNVLVYSDSDGRSPDGAEREARFETIDVWWGGLHRNGGLMLVLAYVLGTSVEWKRARVRLRLCVEDLEAVPRALSNLAHIVEGLRMSAVPQVLVRDGRPFDDLLVEKSADADFVLLGMAEPGDDTANYASYIHKVQERGRRLPPAAFVLAAEGIRFSQVLLEDGHGEPGSA